MPIKVKLGHYYERRDKGIAGPAERRKPWGLNEPYVWRLGMGTYTVRGELRKDGSESKFDLMKDLGTTDPRKPKKPRKAPAKVRKVKMYFYRDNDGDLCGSESRFVAEGWNHSEHGPVFVQIIEVPLQKKKA